jgi:hypothetical protein
LHANEMPETASHSAASVLKKNTSKRSVYLSVAIVADRWRRTDAKSNFGILPI